MKALRILQCSLGVAGLMSAAAVADVPAVYPVPQQNKMTDKTVHVPQNVEPVIDIRGQQKGDTAMLKGVPKKSGAYKLRIGADGKVSIGAHDDRGAFYAKQTLKQLLSPAEGHGLMMPVGEIIDWPDIEFRGTVEGFYGTPWCHESRIEQLKFYGRNKMNTYIYGPKDDPYHSAHWRKPYPEKEAAQIKELVKVAKENHVDFVWAIHPVHDIKWTEVDMGNVIKKFEIMYNLGVRSFAVFFDDISGEGTKADMQAKLMNKLHNEFVKKKGDVTPLVMCPTQYNRGWSHGDYLDVLGDKLDPSIHVMWTGNTVCHDITLEGQQWVNKRLKRPSYVWLNFPVTDFCRANLCMGRAYGNATEPEAKNEMSGFVSNPMDKPEASKVALFGIADYTWNIGAYDSDKSWKTGVKRIFPQAPEAMQVFVDHNSDQGPNGHGYRKEESVRIKPTVDKYLSALRDGKKDEAAYKALMDEFITITNAAPQIRSKVKNPRLMQEIGAWVDAFEKLGSAGVNAMLANETPEGKKLGSGMSVPTEIEALVKATEALSAMDAISRNHNKAGVMYKSEVHTGSLVMAPAVNEMVEIASKKLMSEVAGTPALNPKLIVKGGNMDNADKFMDGDRGSFWHSGAYCAAGDYYGIDYGQPMTLRSVEILMGRNDGDSDYVLKGQLEVSRDMKIWKPLGGETGGRQVVWQAKKPVQVRAIRYRVIEPNRLGGGNAVWTALREIAVNTPAPAMATTSIDSLKGIAVQTEAKLVRIARVMETHKMKPGDHLTLQLEAPTDATWLEVNLENADLPNWAEVSVEVEGQKTPVVQRLEKYNGNAYVVKGDRLPKGIKGMKLVNKSNKEQEIRLTMFKFDVPPSDPGKNLGSLSDKNLKTVYRADSAFSAVVENMDCPKATQVVVVGSAAATVQAKVGANWVDAGKVSSKPGAKTVNIPAGTKAVRLSGAAQPGKIINEVIFRAGGAKTK